MTRIKRGKITVRTRKKLKQKTKGFRGAWSVLSRPMAQIVLKSLNSSYIHRKKRLTVYRKLCISRLNAAVRGLGLPITYNSFIYTLSTNQCKLNRNILTQISVRDDRTFINLVKLQFCEN
ncbi:50S ribosomal protein L20 (plastid) [Lotharella oceanica]|uniref:50S ribosomal protein L20 n=1 Tax=Lotharella oceanica TaxID=641309 RepID=A0A059SLW1_9EUKA|nr:50S ribosomal protein L20 [Lotharella oceanica]